MATRRQFFTTSAASVLMAGLYSKWTLAESLLKPSKAQSTSLNKCFFQDQIASSFVMTNESGQVINTTLLEVQEYKKIEGLEQFSLIFQDHKGMANGSGLFEVRHRKTGKFNMDIDQINETQLRATFSLLC